jgi:hypothetical protein
MTREAIHILRVHVVLGVRAAGAAEASLTRRSIASSKTDSGTPLRARVLTTNSRKEQFVNVSLSECVGKT